MSPGAASVGRLGFVSLALESFDFLSEWGFGLTEQQPTTVRFESDHLFVSVYHDRLSYQVGLEVGRLDDVRWYTLHEVLAAFAPHGASKARCQATDEQVLARCLDGVASTMRVHCSRLLANDSEAFEVLDAKASESRHATTLEAQYGAVIDKADRAWEENDRERAAELYETADPALDAKRRKRLAYVKGSDRGSGPRGR